MKITKLIKGEVKLNNRQVFLLSVISILVIAVLIETFLGKNGVYGVVIGVLLFIWLRFLYDKLPEEKKEEK